MQATRVVRVREDCSCWTPTKLRGMPLSLIRLRFVAVRPFREYISSIRLEDAHQFPSDLARTAISF
jgi:hypothetical protein